MSPGTANEPGGEAGAGRAEPRARHAAAHLVVLCALVVAQPIFDLLSKNPEFFGARGSTRIDIVAFALGLLLVPPAVLLGLELLAGLGHRRARAGLHRAFVGALVGLLVLQVAKRIGLSVTWLALALAASAGVATAVAYARVRGVRSFLTVLSPAPLLFLVLFLFFSPVSKLALESQAIAKRPPVPARTPVVMVIFDEFSLTSLLDRHDRIDPVRYPNFAALARGSSWFRTATAPDDITTSAVPAILTGNLPDNTHLPIASDYPHNLFTLLGGSYRMRVSEEATDLCPTNLCPVAQRGSFAHRMAALVSDLGLVYAHLVAPSKVEAGLPSISQTWGDFAGGSGSSSSSDPVTTPGVAHTGSSTVLQALGGGGRPERFEQWVHRVSPSERPTLFFKHVLLPHVPFQYFPSGRWYQRGGVDAIPQLDGPLSYMDPWLRQQSYQRHLLQVGFTDRLLGSLMRRLRRTGLYDRSLIVVTADNGESFLRNADRHVVTDDNIEDIAPVPLFVKRPYQRKGEVVDQHVRTVDVLPTIADVLHVRVPWPIVGRSLFDRSTPRPDDISISERSGRQLVLDRQTFERRRLEALRQKIDLFGSDGQGPGLFGIGPHPELLGRPLTDLPIEPTGLGAAIDDRAGLRSVHLRSGFVPAHVTGRIVGDPGPGPRAIAVAVNGRIRAMSWSFSLDPGTGQSFSALVPEDAFHDGANRVQVFSVSTGPHGVVLGALPATR